MRPFFIDSMKYSLMQKCKRELYEFRVLMRSVPAASVAIFVLAVFSMNLLANKLISQPFPWLAIDCGITVSWIAFLIMDVLTKHFGPKAATMLSVFAMCGNLLLCAVFFLGASLPGVWGESYVEGSEEIINHALDRTFGGTWYVLLGSAVAFLVSSLVNNFTNYAFGKLFVKNPDGLFAYLMRSYLSTALGQFSDNLVFALLVSHFFFGLSLLQCCTCALTGMIAELLCEAVFSPLGYRICRKWKEENVGKAYLDCKKEQGLK